MPAGAGPGAGNAGIAARKLAWVCAVASSNPERGEGNWHAGLTRRRLRARLHGRNLRRGMGLGPLGGAKRPLLIESRSDQPPEILAATARGTSTGRWQEPALAPACRH
jgi:hypothetical protein